MSVSSVEFVKKFSPKKTAAIYLVFGNESFLRQESIQFIRKQLGEENVFFREYDPEESEIAVANIIMDLSSDALFDDLNLIIVKSADPLVQQLLSPLEKYLKSPNSNSILILELAKADGRSKIVKLADKYGVAIKCQQLYDRPKPWLNLPPWESELVHWLVKRVETLYHKKITPRTAYHLSQYVGSDLQVLDSHLKKICLYLKERATIEAADIEAMVKNSRRGNIFDLLDAICERKLPLAVKLTHQTFTNGLEGKDGAIYDPTHIALQMLRLFHLRFRQIWKVAVSKDTEEMSDFIRKKLVTYAPHFKEERLRVIWQHLLETEHALKSSRLKPALAMEQLVLKLSC